MPSMSDERARHEGLHIQLLGEFAVVVAGRKTAEPEWRLRKAGNLVKLLALAPNRRRHREQVIDLLWPELLPAAASNNLRQVVYYARHILDPEMLRPSYLLVQGDLLLLGPAEEVHVDVDAFEAAAARARGARDPAAYLEAIELYSGDLLPDDPYEDWAIGKREVLRASFLALLGDLALLQEERSETDAAVQTLRRIVALDPTREEAHAGLMRLYSKRGQRKLALRQYEQLKQVLRRELDAEPDQLTEQLRRNIAEGHLSDASASAESDPRPSFQPPRRHNVPVPLTRFVGREREVEEAMSLLASRRLVTLHGPGGCGKTRLALEIARALLGKYRDGVWLLDLSSIASPELVVPTAALVLGTTEIPSISPAEALVAGLQRKELLLIMDGCERVDESAASLCNLLLSSCEDIRVLATSRKTLSIPGEAVYRIAALPVPDPGEVLDPQAAAGYDSIRLFVDRASLVRQDFHLNVHNTAAVVRICRRLDGMPLAIELAAARATVLSVDGIDQRLDNPYLLLIGDGRGIAPRHRALKEVVDWSYELLSEEERLTFEKLSVFAGGWSLEAAEGVCGDLETEKPAKPSSADSPLPADIPVLDILSRLVDKSMVVVAPGPDGDVRGRLLDTMRDYATERLMRRGGTERAREKHFRYYLAMAEQASLHLTGAKQTEWLHRLELEQDNLRAALVSSIENGQADSGLRLALALHHFWFVRGGASEGIGYFARLLELQNREGLSLDEKAIRVRALVAASELAQIPGRFAEARAFAEESLALGEEIGDKQGVANSLRHLGSISLWMGDGPGAHSLLVRSLEMHREQGDRWGTALTLFLLAQLTWFSGDPSAALAMAEESVALWRDVADRRMYAYACGVVASTSIDLGDYDRGQRAMAESLSNVLAVNDGWGVPLALEGFAVLAASQGQPERCLRLAGATSAIRESVGGMAPPPPVLARYQGWLARARGAIGEHAAEAAWAAGRTMTLQQAVEFALAVNTTPASSAVPLPPSSDPFWAPFSSREASIAVLIGRGLTNRQIARELGIVEGTVANHVAHILRKLKLKSRTQIAALVVEHQS